MLNARIKFYDIHKCGYYIRGQNVPNFCDISDCLDKLVLWAKDGRAIINSTTYQAAPDNDIYNAYFSNMYKHEATGEYILVLWNEIPNNDGVVYGLNPYDTPGTVDMLHTGFGNNPAIPGFPSYYWFIPAMNMFAAIKFDHSVLGKQHLDLYLNGFLTNKSMYRVMNNDGAVIGYSPTGQYLEGCDIVCAKFKALSKKKNEVEQELISHINIITRIIKKEVLNYQIEDDRNSIQKFFSGLLENTPQYIDNRMVVHDFPFRPTMEQLQQIITNFRDADDDSSLRNVGFVYNNGKTIMLDGTNVSFTYEFDVRIEENRIIQPDVLYRLVSNARADLLRACN